MIPIGYVDSVEEYSISTGYHTDHSLVKLRIKINQYRRGPGMWKFNNRLLQDVSFCRQVREIISAVQRNCIQLDACKTWECIKMEVGAFCKLFTKGMIKQCSAELKELLLYKEKCLFELNSNPSDATLHHKLKDVESKLDEHTRRKAEECIFQSQCQYVCDGEKCTSYFVSLEKSRYLEKNMKAVVLDDGKVSYQQKVILQEQTKFYKALYSKDDDVHFALTLSSMDKRIMDMDRAMMEEPLALDKLYDAVMTLKNGKVPGIDGFTVEFYRHFWKDLSVSLFEMLRYSYEVRLLPLSVWKGLISLLPKKNKDTHYVQNMRPLTLIMTTRFW